MKTRTLRNLVAGVGLAVIATASPAMAENLVWTADPGASPSNDRARLFNSGLATNLAQEFTLAHGSTLETLAFHGLATNVNLFIVDDLGLTASDSENVLWSTLGYTAESSNYSWHEFDLGELELSAGSYFVVMTSESTTGGRWSRITRVGSSNVEDRGNALYTFSGGIRVADLDYEFHNGESEPAYAIRMTGEAIPTPGSAAIAAIGGILIAGRRRR